MRLRINEYYVRLDEVVHVAEVAEVAEECPHACHCPRRDTLVLLVILVLHSQLGRSS